MPKKIVPEAVLLLFAGAVLGPHMVGTIQDDQTIQFMAKLGLAFQFLIAGYEINPKLLTGKRGKKGLATWAVTFALALGAAALLFDPAENFMAFAAVAIAMTSTACPRSWRSRWARAPSSRCATAPPSPRTSPRRFPSS